MTDRRLTPDPEHLRTRIPARVTVPVSDLCRSPDGPRDRQMLLGDGVTVFSEDDGWSYVQAARDGYCGFLRSETVGPALEPTHRVAAPATQAYSAPDIKSPDRMTLSFGCQLCATSESATFIETPEGHVPRQHVHRIGTYASDPASVAELFLGTPYLWGGNSRNGIDCSGLVQAAMLACDIDCPGDSDMQRAHLGTDLPAGSDYRRNDLIFWTGHVALVTGPDMLIHANGGHMAVAVEGIANAISRIERQGDGLPTAHKRLPPA
ncbi:NlpC/P60 family protein [Sulfitobacter sp. D35]|uniref:C40 family peptidase n=1 Tax=Sulfitobacter sp. D35 TaxID=3083252 RepID=UPI00296F4C0F|nr:NlpC/P60 family protein [Sulfitobacter sp. D35]MDW4498307.1 NlpC/P60 family protein [Sulfitobacter sp. D35]